MLPSITRTSIQITYNDMTTDCTTPSLMEIVGAYINAGYRDAQALIEEIRPHYYAVKAWYNNKY